MKGCSVSLESIETEIRRFLSSPTPEVLCIKGKWGVGKTFGWRKFLSQAKDAKSMSMQKYSYVSLFGLSSLDDLRYSIFENTVTGNNIGSEPSESTFQELLKNSNLIPKLSYGLQWAAAFFNRKGLGDLLSKSAFLTVHQQLVCLDDLERSDKGLSVREVLGLSSLLKEQRKCKVVLLLNDIEHDEKDEFDRQLEKVADTVLRFDLTPTEAVSIALTGSGKATELLRPRVVGLGLTNIRTIKKIERLAAQLVDVLGQFDSRILEESVATAALACWSIQEPNLAPPLDFLRSYSSLGIALRSRNNPLDAETDRHHKLLEKYSFNGSNFLDKEIINNIESGYLNVENLLVAANIVKVERIANSGDQEFNRVWQDLYHGSLVVEDDDFLTALTSSAVLEAGSISALNINSAVRILRETNRNDDAEKVISAYISAHDSKPYEFFSIRSHHFSAEDNLDNSLRDAFAARRAAHIDTRDPLAVLRAIGESRNWSEADSVLLTKLSVDDFVRIFEALRGKEVRDSIGRVLDIGISQSEGSESIKVKSLEALRRIADKSPLRKRKIQAMGIQLETDPNPT